MSQSPIRSPLPRKALITGITGQDGAYLAEFLLEQGLRGARHQAPLVARSTPTASTTSTRTRTSTARDFILHYGDLTDSIEPDRASCRRCSPTRSTTSPRRATSRCRFEEPEYTANADALGTLRLLEAIRILGLEKKTRFYQASTSELYGLVQEMPQTRDHAVLSALALRGGQALRLLDHGQLPRGLRHVRLQRHPVQSRVARCAARPSSRARSPARWRASSSACRTALYLGNLDAQRDWGHARDYVEMQWLMLQQDKPEDFVIATGEQYSVREFVAGRAERSASSSLRGQASEWRRDEKGDRAKRSRPGHRRASTRATSARPRSRRCSATRPRRSEKLGWTPAHHASTSWSPR